MKNYDNVVAIDEATKKFMGFMNEDINSTINEGISAALRHTNQDIEELQEKVNVIMNDEKRNRKLLEEICECNIPSKLGSMEDKLAGINELVEGQAVLISYVKQLEKELQYLKLPFYKKWFYKEGK